MKSLNTIVVILLSVTLLILGYRNHYELMNYSLWQFPDVSFISIGLGHFGNPLLFLIGIAMIPAGYFILNRTVEVRSLLQALLYVAFTAGCGLCFWWLRICYLQNLLEEFRIDPSVRQSISVNKLQFEQYMMFGILIGILISWVLLKIVNKKKNVERISLQRFDDSLIDQGDNTENS